DPAQGAVLTERDVPQPKPRPGEVSVRVYAAGVTPTELLWYPTSHHKNGDPRHERLVCGWGAGGLLYHATAMDRAEAAETQPCGGCFGADWNFDGVAR